MEFDALVREAVDDELDHLVVGNGSSRVERHGHLRRLARWQHLWQEVVRKVRSVLVEAFDAKTNRDEVFWYITN